jgi:L-ascorbate metabolism protein UlaG (beta-lactamase superfamily)
MSKTAVTRITHSSHLIEIGGRTFLTDPWFSSRPGYYQGEPIAVGIADLPRLDGVLITHEHYDHCDLEAFAAYRDQSVPLFVAETVVETARKHGFTDVTALAPWQEVEVGGVTITAIPPSTASTRSPSSCAQARRPCTSRRSGVSGSRT